jgi:hypothetical protein
LRFFAPLKNDKAEAGMTRGILTLVLSLKGEDILLYIYFHLLPNPLPYRKRELR